MFPIAAILVSLAAGSPATNDPGAAPASVAAANVALQNSAAGYRATGSAEVIKPHAAEARAAIGAEKIGEKIADKAGEKNDLNTNGLLAAGSNALAGISGNATAAAIANSGNASTAAEGSESHHGFPAGSMIPLIGFGLCGAAAMIFARKKQVTPKLLEIVETHGLGGRRSLIVARIAGETLLLGSSEAGLSLLLARPGEFAAQPEAAMPMGSNSALSSMKQPAQAATPTQRIAGALNGSWLGKLRLAHAQERANEEANEPSFESLLAQDAENRAVSRARAPNQIAEPALLRQPLDPLAESAEDQELRRKLAQGRSGRIA